MARGFVTIVEIEKHLSDIAATAGMASGDVGLRHAIGTVLRQFGDKVLDERDIGLQMNERRQTG